MKKISTEILTRMKTGQSYRIDKDLLSLQKRCNRLLILLQLISSTKIRNYLFKRLFKSFGDGNIIKSGFKCNYGFNIHVGSNCYFNYNLTILDSFEVYIGNNVFIAPNVVIAPVTHPKEKEKRRDLIGGPIIIEDDVWIGANAVILPNCRIKKGTVVGAGAIIKGDTEEDSVYVGAPAIIKEKL